MLLDEDVKDAVSKLAPKSPLIVVDFQNDFCPGGSLPVPDGDKIAPLINKLAQKFKTVITTQDWHPPNHVSFVAQGGQWPVHAVMGTFGAELHPDFDATVASARVIKGNNPDKEAYSAFQDTDLHDILKGGNFDRVFICGLATDYCVRATVLDALRLGYEVYLVEDAVRAVNVNPDDGENALAEMQTAGAKLIHSDWI
jgi:nicotinamidase/pyrazinamidase